MKIRNDFLLFFAVFKHKSDCVFLNIGLEIVYANINSKMSKIRKISILFVGSMKFIIFNIQNIKSLYKNSGN